MLQFYPFTEATHLKLHPFHCPIHTQLITQPSLSSGHSSRPLAWPLVPSDPSLPSTLTALIVWTTTWDLTDLSWSYAWFMHLPKSPQEMNSHSTGTEENFIKENSSLGEGLIIGTVAWRKEFIHHQEKAQQGRSQECALLHHLLVFSLLTVFPLSGTTKKTGEETGRCSPWKSPCWTLSRPKREFVFRKAAEFICLAS